MKTVKQFIITMMLIVAALSLTSPLALAQDGRPSLLPLPDAGVFGDVPDPGSGTATEQVNTLVGGLIAAARNLLGAVAIIMFIYAGFRMVIGWGKEDVYSKQRLNLLYAIIGLAVVGLAGEMAQIFSVEGGGFIKDPNQILRTAILFDERTQIVITFLKYTIGAIAVLMIIRSGLRMITMGQQEDKVALDKKNLIYGGIGLFMVLMADNVINNVFYKVDLSRYPGAEGAQPAIDAPAGVSEIVGATNLIISIVGPLAILVLVGGGIMYITAGGQEDRMEKAKKLIIATLAGILLIYGAFAIVSTFISGSFA